MDLFMMGIGNKSEISISKIKNNTVVEKNCNGIGFRVVVVLENPHSKVDHLFCLGSVFNEISLINVNSIITSAIKISNTNVIFIIFLLFVWKTNVLLYFKDRILISKFLYIRIVRLRLQSVNIRLRIQILLCVLVI